MISSIRDVQAGFGSWYHNKSDRRVPEVATCLSQTNILPWCLGSMVPESTYKGIRFLALFLLHTNLALGKWVGSGGIGWDRTAARSMLLASLVRTQHASTQSSKCSYQLLWWKLTRTESSAWFKRLVTSLWYLSVVLIVITGNQTLLQRTSRIWKRSRHPSYTKVPAYLESL
jgi:hypothetical protein